MSSSKIVGLQEAAGLIEDDAIITMGGSLLQRIPAAFTRELVRQNRHGLHLVKPSPGYDGDLLAAAGVLRQVSAGMVSLEQPYGLARGFRRSVEEGRVAVTEHACITVASALRASALGIPFQPIPGLNGSDITASAGFVELTDPDGGDRIWAVRALRPDWAVLHVAESDDQGNARIYGTPNWDPLMAEASSNVILTAEKIVDSSMLAKQPELTTINQLNVRAVVHAPHGAWPTNCYPYYRADDAAIQDYIAAVESGRVVEAVEAWSSFDRGCEVTTAATAREGGPQ